MSSSARISMKRSSSTKHDSIPSLATKDMVWIDGGSFMMGSYLHYPEEAPAHPMSVDGFWIDKYTVTNAQFSKFFEATNYITLAERAPNAADYPGALRIFVGIPVLLNIYSDVEIEVATK